VLEVDDDDGALSSTASSLAGVPLPASGTYYLLVSCQRPRQVVVPYDLYVRLQSRTPAEETSATANAPGQTLSGAHWVGGVVQSGAETDTYQVTLNAGDTIFASLDLDPTRTGRGWDGRLSLNPLSAPSRIFAINGSDAHRIHQPDNDTPPGSEALLLTVKDAGTYSLAVSSVDGNHGAYHLSVSIIPAATENASATYPATLSNHEIGDGGTLTSTLAIPTAQRIGKLKVGLNLAHANLPDLDVHLTAPSGNTVGLFRNVSDAAHTTLDVILDDGAAYAIGFDQEDADNPLPEVAGAIFKPGRDYRLAWFAGQQAQGSWTLTIRDRHSDGKTGTLNNWSLTVIADDELPGGTETVHYASDFENSNGGFVASSDNSPNQWNHGTPAAAPIASAHSGTKAWKTNLTGNYDSSSNQDLFSPEIDLTDVSSRNPIVLSWAMNYQLGDASQDGAYIEVQEVGGSNLARVVWRWLGSAMRDTGVGFNSTTIEEAAGWGVHRALISDFAGKMVRVRFHLDRNSGDDFAGLAIDDVSIASYHDAPPTVLTVVRHHNASATTAAGTLMYRVQFSEPVQNVTSTSFGLTSVGGNVSGTISSVVGSGSVYYVTVTGVTGSGALRMDVLSGTIANENGRVLVNGFTSGQSYTRVASVRAYAWGSNSSGKLGNGTMFSRPLPGFVQTGGASALAGKTVAALAYGGEHTLALDSAGKAYAWGNNVQRQLGDGSNDGASLPLAVSTTGALAGKTIVAIAAGYVHSLALDSDGHVYSWGYNTAGELGLGSTAENIGEPTQVAGLLSGKTIVAIAAGRNHSLALASDGSLYAWGSANEAQLGNGVSGNNAKSNVPVGVTMTGALVGKTIVGISAGLYHNLVLASDGTAYGWGWNSTGQLGDGGHFEASEPVAVDIGSSSALEGKTLIAVAAGTDHSLALDSAGKVYAWGFNISGQLGTSNGAGPHYLPRGVNLPSSVIATAISAGADHSFALTSDGVLYGWGSSSNGQLGNGSWDDQPSPVLVDTSATSALQGASVLALGSGGSFADDALVIGQTSQPVVETLTTPDTGAYKLGRTLVFELTADRAVTVNTHGGTPRLVLSFDSGEVYADYVATSEDGKRLRFSYAVNDGDSGSSGIGLEPYLDLNGGSIVDAADGTLALTPVFAAPDLGGIVVDAIAPTIRSINRAGGAIEATGLTTVAFNVIFSEAVNSDGEELSVENFSVVALGGNVSGRVSDVRLVAGAGEGRAARSAGRSRRSGATIYRATVADLAGEGEFAIALSSSHLIGDVAGNLLTGSVTSQSYTRFEHASAFAWGEGGDGQLGNGNSETSDVPVALHANGALAGKAIVALAHGAHHTLALTSDGQVYGWGKNSDGQLAIENDFIAEPVAISPTGALNGKFVVAIAAGDSFSVALTSEGEVITWGRNESGELGIDSDDDFNAVPTLVDLSRFDSPRIVAIATGTHHVLALAENGNVYAWGANNVGQLGNEETSEAEPAPVRAYPSNAVAAVSAGANHSLALTFEGEVLSWGGNEAGQLGDGSTEDRLWSENVAFPDLDSGEQPADGIASIVAGDRYSLALTVDGRLFAWGANDTGQLGSSNHDNFSEPSHVTLWNDVRLATIAPGRNHVLALATDGTVYGWGDNTHRQLALLDDEVFRQPFRLELTGITRAYVLGSGVAADHGTLLGAVSPAFHSADTNHDWSLSLLELTRVVELYNARDGTTRTGEYHTQLGTEDGFASGAGTITAYHSADTNHDGKLSLLELTRVIELYNTYDRTSRTGVYHATEFGTEDGFAPGPSVRS
jgi:alpha-tubulin suppressor-like RCC1 family protein/subtilisin-like proprotein convertase family protein